MDKCSKPDLNHSDLLGDLTDSHHSTPNDPGIVISGKVGSFGLE